MINENKSTKTQHTAQIAGVHPGDNNMEFVGEKSTQQVLWIQNGHALPFEFLPRKIYRNCQQQYLNDGPAVEQLNKLNVSEERKVELYIYHLYGDLDTTPDVINEELQPSENFRHTKTCNSVNWDTKWITMNGVALTNRDLRIIDFLIEGLPDKAIAAELGISTSTFDFHKRNLYKKTGVQCKIELVIKALKQHIS